MIARNGQSTQIRIRTHYWTTISKLEIIRQRREKLVKKRNKTIRALLKTPKAYIAIQAQKRLKLALSQRTILSPTQTSIWRHWLVVPEAGLV